MFVFRGCQIRTSVWWSLRKRLSHRYASSSAGAEPATVDEDKSQDLGPTAKPYKQPFLKNLFIGKFDQDFLVYPEVVDLDELRQRTIENINVESSKDEGAVTRMSVQEKVKNILKSNVPIVSDSETKDSERVKIYELMDIDLQTALLMETQSIVISIISRFGSTELKAKYLKKLMTGEITGAFAMSEPCTGSDPSSLESIADFDENTESYAVSGTKEWVTNGKNADVLIVLATTDAVHGQPRREVTAFLVEKGSPGIVKSDQESRDLRDCGLVRIQFDKTPVPESNVIGEVGQGIEVAARCISLNRYFVTSSLLNTMKKIFNEVHRCIKSRKQYPIPLKDCELIQYKLSEVGTKIYALESLIYLYTGMIDSYNVEMMVESASLQLFCYESALETVKICNEILGGKSYDGNHHYMTLLSEIQGLILASKTQSILQLFISLCSIQYAGVSIYEMVRRNRNPLDYPGFVVKRLLSNRRQDNDSPKLELQLYMNLHPSLKDAAEVLEYAVLRLKYAVEVALSRYGSDVVNKQVDLCRFADVATEIFAMTAVLGRASRSYCTGIRFCDQEMLFASAYCLGSLQRIRLKINQVIDGGKISNDTSRLKIGTEIFNQGGYFLEHPLVRNIK
uniref:Acyl-CoA dehydrogenase family member 9, mitochondrial n=1 Tax=Lygus hesperus TaxID=30085 RepID=A0A0A9YYK3_LYGHE